MYSESSQYIRKAQATAQTENLYIDTHNKLQNKAELARATGCRKECVMAGGLSPPILIVLNQRGRGRKRRSGMAALRGKHVHRGPGWQFDSERSARRRRRAVRLRAEGCRAMVVAATMAFSTTNPIGPTYDN